jgi:sugar O-acyltransferase (sialic acid O-acetyltransferase NeuD family)
MSGVLVLGAGGHAKVVVDILQMQRVSVLGYLDDDPNRSGTIWLELPVLGQIEDYRKLGYSGLVMGVGSNKARQKVVNSLGHAVDDLWVNAIHPFAIVARSAKIGRGVVIAAQAVINPGAVIGDHVIINTAATVDHDCVIGDYAHIAPGVHLAGGVQVGRGVLVGIGAQVIPNRTIGAWATIGAGATVIHNIPAKVIAKGTPAKWS